MTNQSSKFLPRKTVRDQIEDKRGYLFDEETGYVYELNETGCKIWILLKEGLSNEEIVSKMAQEYDVDVTTLENDVKEFLKRLVEYGILEVVR